MSCCFSPGSVSICARATKAILNHAHIGKDRRKLKRIG